MGLEVKVCVVGLGYVGLPVALAFAEKYPHTVGFDNNEAKVKELRNGIDRTQEIESHVLRKSTLHFSNSPQDMANSNFYVIAVPTPVDEANIPDLTAMIKASESVGKFLKRGDIVVYESTVYPGVTEEVCAPVLERVSGLKALNDFKLGYSPERINPGDKERTLAKIVKVVSGQDSETLEKVAAVYSKIISAGVYKASSIKVAEAAKVIENTQRDLNIALVNELAVIFDRMGIATTEVLKAAGTKWNFLNFRPGLVGGHCIGVDPYYLTYRAQELGLHPQVITAGRRINDSIPSFIAQKAIKLMLSKDINPRTAKVGMLGLTFKENVSDIRNSKIPSIIRELEEFGVRVQLYDPLADSADTKHEYGITLASEEDLNNCDLLIFAVPHDCLLLENSARVMKKVKPDGVLIDVKSAVRSEQRGENLLYWSL